MNGARSADRYLTTAEFAELTRIPEGTIRQWRHRQYGPTGIKMGRAVRYRLSTIEAWIKECERAEADRRVPA
ncbi:helix-turn-helix domain-containing protein [Frankia sp. Ag45/Mut15]|uniref:Helix-turn-helix domain-containing protein n=1 Tax=Frankia umida TaxID=573489 RepID=A0ABT0JYQ7_9ACTN|nr:helix-turn-helix domain-containing protein [Frankia umida]MCK9876636.1 helix-turn-helix domain-containing protein [Frankia umida]